MATKIKKRSPKKELNTWLRVNRSWDHSEWKDLLKKIFQINVSLNCVLRLVGKMILVFTWKLNDIETKSKS